MFVTHTPFGFGDVDNLVPLPDTVQLPISRVAMSVLNQPQGDFKDIKEIKGANAGKVRQETETKELKVRQETESKELKVKLSKVSSRINKSQKNQIREKRSFFELMGIQSVVSKNVFSKFDDSKFDVAMNEENSLHILTNVLGSVHLLSGVIEHSFEGSRIAALAESFRRFLCSDAFKNEFQQDDYLKFLVSALNNIRDIYAFSKKCSSESFTKNICSLITNLNVGESVFIPGGWEAKPGETPHELCFVICRTSISHCSMGIINTGDGIEYHPSCYTTSRESEKQKYSPVLIHPNIKIRDITNKEIWKAHYCLNFEIPENEDSWRNSKCLYEFWLNAISPNFLQKAIDYTAKFDIEYITPQPAAFSAADSIFALLSLISPAKEKRKGVKLAYKFDLIKKNLAYFTERTRKQILTLTIDKINCIPNVKANLDLYDILMQDFIRSVNKARSDKVITIDLAEQYSLKVEELLKYNLESHRLVTKLMRTSKLELSTFRKGNLVTIDLPDVKEIVFEENRLPEVSMIRVDCSIPDNADQLLSKWYEWHKQFTKLLSGTEFQKREVLFFTRDILTNLISKQDILLSVNSKMAASLMYMLDFLQRNFYLSFGKLPRDTNVRVEHVVLIQRCTVLMWKLFTISENLKDSEIDRKLIEFSDEEYIFSQNPQLTILDNFPRSNKRSLFTEYANPENFLINTLHLIQPFVAGDLTPTESYIYQILKSNPGYLNELRSKILNDKDNFRIPTTGKTIVTDHCVLAWCLAYPDKHLPPPLFQMRRSAIIYTLSQLFDNQCMHETALTGLRIEKLSLAHYADNIDSDLTLVYTQNHIDRNSLLELGYNIQSENSGLSYKDFKNLIKNDTQNGTMLSMSEAVSLNEISILFGKKVVAEFQLIRSRDDQATHQLRNALAFFTKHRSKLFNKSFRFLFETVFFEKNYLIDALKKSSDFGKLLSKFIHESYQFVLARLANSELSSTLFILRMGTYFKQYAPQVDFPDLIASTDVIIKECGHLFSEQEMTLIYRERLAYLGRLENGVTVQNYGMMLKELIQYRERPALPRELNHQKLNHDIYLLHHRIVQIIKGQDEKELHSQLGFRCLLQFPFIRSVDSTGKFTNKYEIDLQEACMFVDGATKCQALPQKFLTNPIWVKHFKTALGNFKNIKVGKIENQVFYTFTDHAGYSCRFFDRYYYDSLERIINGHIYTHVKLSKPLNHGELWQKKGHSEGLVIDDDGKIRCHYREIGSANGKKIFSLCSLEEGDTFKQELSATSISDFHEDRFAMEKIFFRFDDDVLFWMESLQDRLITLIEFRNLNLKFKPIWDGTKLVRIEGLAPYQNYVVAKHQFIPKLFRFQNNVLVLMEKKTKAKKVLIRQLKEDRELGLNNWGSTLLRKEGHVFYELDLNSKEAWLQVACLNMLHRNYELALNVLKEQGYSFNKYTDSEKNVLRFIQTSPHQNNPCAFALQIRAYLLILQNTTQHSLKEVEKVSIDRLLINNYYRFLSHIPNHFRLNSDEEEMLINSISIPSEIDDVLSSRIQKKPIKTALQKKDKYDVKELIDILNQILVEEKTGEEDLFFTRKPRKKEPTFSFNLLSLAGTSNALYWKTNFCVILKKILDKNLTLAHKKRLRTYLKLTPSILAKFLLQILNNPKRFGISKNFEVNFESIKYISQFFKTKTSLYHIPVYCDPIPVKKKIVSVPLPRIQYDAKLAASRADTDVQKAIVTCPKGLISQMEKKIGTEWKEVIANVQSLQKQCKNRVENRSFNEFIEEISDYAKEPKFDYSGDKAGLKDYRKQLVVERKKYWNSEKALREKILTLANKESNDRELRVQTKNRILGKSLKTITIGDLLKAFISDDDLSNELIKQYQNLNPFLTVEDCFSIHQKLKDYLLFKSYQQKLNRICVAIERYLNLSSKNDENEYLREIFKEINSVREYDPDLSPKFLVCETARSILLRKSQVENLKLFNNENSNVALQMAMGEGKTVIMLPFIALMQAQQGKKLSVLMFPEELLSSATYTLQKACQIFNCRLNRINWSDLSEKNLKNILTRFDEIIAKREILVVSNSEIHKFNNAFWEAMNSNSYVLDLMYQIVRRLENESIVTIDELHNCSPTDHDVRLATGTDTTLKNDIYHLCVYIFELLTTDPTITQKYSFNFHASKQQGAGVPFSFNLDQETKNILIDKSLKWLVDKYPKWQKIISAHYQEIFSFCNSKIGEGTAPKQLDSELNEFLGLLKGQLKTLDFTLKRNHYEHFGLFQEDNQNGKLLFSPIAGPFKCAGTPNYGSQFANMIERINLTIQSFYASPKAIPQFLWKEILRMKENTKIDMNLGKPIEETTGYLEFSELTQTTKFRLKPTEFITMQESQLDNLSIEIWKNVVALNNFVARYILPSMKIYPNVLVSDAWQLLKRFGKVNGCTGTPTDHLQAQFSNVVKEKGSNGKVICLLAKDSIGNEIAIKDGTDPMQILYQLITGENSKHLALIDAGALFKEILMHEAAELILKVRTDLSGVVFYQDDEEMVMLRGKKRPIKTNGIDYTLNNNNVFLLLGQRQCIGIDKQLPITAKAWITTNPQVTYTNLSQAAMRLRKLGFGQTLQFVAMESTYQIAGQALGKKSKINAVDLALLAKLQEVNKLSRSNLISLTQGIRNVVVHTIEMLLDRNKNHQPELAQLLIVNQSISFWEQHHPIEILANDREAIQLIINRHLTPLKNSRCCGLFDFKVMTEQMWRIADRYLTKSLINEKVQISDQDNLQKAVTVSTQTKTEASHNQNNQTNHNVQSNMQQEIESKLSHHALNKSSMPRIQIGQLQDKDYLSVNFQYDNSLKGAKLEMSIQAYLEQRKTIPIMPMTSTLEIGSIQDKNHPISFSKSLYCSADFAFTCHHTGQVSNNDILSESAPFGFYQKPPEKCLIIRSKENPNDFRFILISGKEAEEIEMSLENRLGLMKNQEQIFKMYDIALYIPALNYFYPSVPDNSLLNNEEFIKCQIQYRILAGLYIPKQLEKEAVSWVKSHSSKTFEEFYLRLIKFDGNLRSNYEFSQMKNWVKESSV